MDEEKQEVCVKQAEWYVWPTDKDGQPDLNSAGRMLFVTACDEHLGSQARESSKHAHIRRLRDFEKGPGRTICGWLES